MGQIIFFIVISIWIILDFYIAVFHNKSKPKSTYEKKSKYIIIIAILIGMLVGPFLIPGTKTSFLLPFAGLRYLSIVCILCGVTLRIVSIIQLQDGFSDHISVSKDKKLKTSGLYKFIRHPSYLGELLNFLGVAIAYNHLLSSSIALFVPWTAFLYRMHIEEVVLSIHYKQEYKDYQAKTKKIIPFLY